MRCWGRTQLTGCALLGKDEPAGRALLGDVARGVCMAGEGHGSQRCFAIHKCLQDEAGQRVSKQGCSYIGMCTYVRVCVYVCM